jgi:hypothetical protein
LNLTILEQVGHNLEVSGGGGGGGGCCHGFGV